MEGKGIDGRGGEKMGGKGKRGGEVRRGEETKGEKGKGGKGRGKKKGRRRCELSGQQDSNPNSDASLLNKEVIEGNLYCLGFLICTISSF